MAFTPPTESYIGKVCSVTIGVGDTAVTFGAENVLSFHSFEGSTPNRPVIAYEIQDIPPSEWPEQVRKPFDGVSNDPVSWAKFCQDVLKAKAIALRLAGTHPDGENRSPEVAAAMPHNHKLIAMSELDINLSKQLNILIIQMGLERERIITDPMSSALGYGLEYTYSVMERIKLAALTQNETP